MADQNLNPNGNDQQPDPTEKLAGNPGAGARTPEAPEGTVPTPPAASAEAQGGKPSEIDDPHAAAAPAASAPPPPGPAANQSANTPEQQARIDAMRAKIEAAKAAQGATGGSASAAPAAAGGSGDAEKDRKVAEMKAKIEAAKAAKGGAAGVATSTATAVAAPASAPAAGAAKPAPAKAAPRRAAKPAPAPAKPAVEPGVWYFGRRNFLQSIGWMSFFGFFTMMLLGTLRAMFPRVIYERPPVFKAGFPGDFLPGTVSEKYKDEERVWIVRQTDGSFIALSAICTHLGCTPRWLTAENKFKCPCHGSGFRGTPEWGVNFEGPAPRPLERVAIHLAPDGQIEIDKSKKFLWEKGQWEDPAATLSA